MDAFNKKCFVCNAPLVEGEFELNFQVNMPVCKSCKGTEAEKNTEAEFLDSLADGLVCGCI